MKILIVDDHPEIVSILIERLSLRGHEVWGLTEGQEVFHWLESREVQVILLDVRLRDVDGLQIISRLTQSTPTKVIAMSGSLDDHTRKTALRNGALDFLPKPIPFDRLLRVLETAVSQSKSSAAGVS